MTKTTASVTTGQLIPYKNLLLRYFTFLPPPNESSTLNQLGKLDGALGGVQRAVDLGAHMGLDVPVQLDGRVSVSERLLHVVQRVLGVGALELDVRVVFVGDDLVPDGDFVDNVVSLAVVGGCQVGEHQLCVPVEERRQVRVQIERGATFSLPFLGSLAPY